MREILFKAKRLDNGFPEAWYALQAVPAQSCPVIAKHYFQKAKALFAAIPVMMLTPPRSASTPA